MRGKVIKRSAKLGVYVQIDKNNQICDLYNFDRSFPKEERIREHIRGKIYDMFKGRPLYTAWPELVEILTRKEVDQ